MKKILAMTMALAMMLSLAACGKKDEPSVSGSTSTSNGSSVSTSASNGADFTTVTAGKLTMSTNAAFPPYEMVTDDGKFEGIDVEVAGAIAEKLGLELVVDDMGFDAALLAAQNGQSDIVMAGVTVTEKRKEVMDFSDSYATGVQVVIVKEGSDIKSVDDLFADGANHSIGVQTATTGDIYCTGDIEDEGLGTVERYNKGADAVQALLAGKIDCVVIDSQPAKEFVEANEGLTILDTEYAVEDYAIALNKDNTELLDKVNAALIELTDDGTIQSILDKYITAD